MGYVWFVLTIKNAPFPENTQSFSVKNFVVILQNQKGAQHRQK